MLRFAAFVMFGVSSPRRDSESAGANRALELAKEAILGWCEDILQGAYFHDGFLPEKLFFDDRFSPADL
jgi:hypothetical protein